MVEKYKLYSGLLFGSIWIILCQGFIATEIPAFEVMIPILNLLTDAVFILLGVWATRSKRDIFITVSFFVIVLISKYLNHQSLFVMVNGCRTYIGLLMCAPIIRYLLHSKYAEDFTRRMDSLCWTFLYLQAFCITWQFIRYGANDYGGGSFGWGGSGQVSTLIYIVSFYLLSKRWDFSKKWLENFKENKANFILLYPTFLNETKISFIFLMIYFMLLYPIDKKYILRALAVFPLVLVMMFGAFYVYLSATEQEGDSVLNKEFLDIYLFGGEDPQELIDLAILYQEEQYSEDNLWVLDLPRFTKIFAAYDVLKDMRGGLDFGVGVGQFKGGTYVSESKFASRYGWLMGGTKPTMLIILLDLGLAGVVWIIVNLAAVLFTRNRSPFAIQLRLYLFAIWSLIMVYDQQLTVLISVWFMFYIAMSGLQPELKEQRQKTRHRGLMRLEASEGDAY